MEDKDTTELLMKFADAEIELWRSFGIDPQGYNIQGFIESPWWVYGPDSCPHEISWVLDGEVYSGELYGSYYWENNTHAIAVMYDGCGNKDASIFLKSLRVDECPEEYDGY